MTSRVADGDGGRVRVAAVDDQLRVGVAAGVDLLGEIAGHHQPHHHLPPVDRADQVVVVVHPHAEGEIARAAETADELPAPHRVALVPHGHRHVVHVQRQGVAEQRQQQRRRGQGHQQTAIIAQNVQDFLAGDGRDAAELHRATSCSGCSARSRASIRATNTSSSVGSRLAVHFRANGQPFPTSTRAACPGRSVRRDRSAPAGCSIPPRPCNAW